MGEYFVVIGLYGEIGVVVDCEVEWIVGGFYWFLVDVVVGVVVLDIGDMVVGVDEIVFVCV